MFPRPMHRAGIDGTVTMDEATAGRIIKMAAVGTTAIDTAAFRGANANACSVSVTTFTIHVTGIIATDI